MNDILSRDAPIKPFSPDTCWVTTQYHCFLLHKSKSWVACPAKSNVSMLTHHTKMVSGSLVWVYMLFREIAACERTDCRLFVRNKRERKFLSYVNSVFLSPRSHLICFIRWHLADRSGGVSVNRMHWVLSERLSLFFLLCSLKSSRIAEKDEVCGAQTLQALCDHFHSEHKTLPVCHHTVFSTETRANN